MAADILPVIEASPETVEPADSKVPVIVVLPVTAKVPLTVALPVTVEPADANVPVIIVLAATAKVPPIVVLPVTDKHLFLGLYMIPQLV